MKLTFALITIAILQANANGLAQTINLTVKNMPVELVLAKVEKQTGYVFMYAPSILSGSRSVSLDAQSMPLFKFLQLICKDQPFRFSIRSKTILLMERNAELPEGFTLADSTSETELLLQVRGVVLGEHQLPLRGASVRRAGRNVFTMTDSLGRFMIEAEKGDLLHITYVGYEIASWRVTGTEVKITLTLAEKNLDDVTVINTGYRKIKANEMVGAVEVVNEKMLQQQVSPNILDRLKTMTSTLQFISKNSPSKISGNPNSVLNMNIRGWSTINGPTDPLIILDNFPYDGDINNINPNDIASIQVLKDAAAAGAWGARAGNGVIVINTKRGRFNQKTQINFSSTVTVAQKPDLYDLPLLSTSEYIDLEILMLNANPPDINAVDGRSPLLQIWIDRLKGNISAADSAAKVDHLKSIDSREEWNKHIYVNPLRQQYSLGLDGGSSNISWRISGSHVRDLDRVQARNERTTFAIRNQFKIMKGMELDLNLDYTNAKDQSGAPEFNSQEVRVPYLRNRKPVPYLQLLNNEGKPLPIEGNLTKEITDTLAGGKLLDFNYYPITNWKQAYEKQKRNSYRLMAVWRYIPLPGLRLEVSSELSNQQTEDKLVHGKESQYTRQMVNTFSLYDRASKILTRNLPWGDIVKVRNYHSTTLKARAEAGYEKKIGKLHHFNVIGTMDIGRVVRESNGMIILGYNEHPLYSSIVDLNSIFPNLLPNSNSQPLRVQLGAHDYYTLLKNEQRSVALLGTFSYVLDKRYVFQASVRRDGANVLGVATNERWKPLWTAGVSWPVHKEKFFKLKWVNAMVFRMSTGVTGNVDVTKTSKAIMNVISGNPFPGANISVPPNPGLRWEQITDWNFGLEIEVLNRINVSTDFYIKKGRDLYGQIINDFTQSFAATIKGNASSMDSHGWEMRIRSRNIVGKFSWSTTLNLARRISKVLHNYVGDAVSPANAVSDGSTITDMTIIFPGQSLYGVTAYSYAGLNNQGQIQYLVDGKPTTNLNDVLADIKKNGQNAGSFKYVGPSDPVFAGNIHNAFVWRNLSLHIAMTFKFGHYFRKSTVEGDFLINGSYHKDWARRWQKPGDELITSIPASIPGNSGNFSQYSQTTDVIRKADHIRLNYITLDYMVPLKMDSKVLKGLRLSLNVDNAGLIWVANKEKLDPENDRDIFMFTRPVRAWSLTLSATF